jgi:hypothetical protein
MGMELKVQQELTWPYIDARCRDIKIKAFSLPEEPRALNYCIVNKIVGGQCFLIMFRGFSADNFQLRKGLLDVNENSSICWLSRLLVKTSETNAIRRCNLRIAFTCL